jgi:hypothetical protein
MNDEIIHTPEQVRARGRRNVVIALSIAAFVVLVFFVSMARMTANMHAAHPVAGATP